MEFLFRVERFRAHAAHVAIALYEANLLSVASNVQSGILSRDPSDRPSASRRLNFARLVMLYVRRFESTDPVEALHYFYFLRALRGPKGDNLYTSCVAELVLESREFDLLLGSISPDGSRVPGLIERLQSGPNDTQKVKSLASTLFLDISYCLYNYSGNRSRCSRV